MKATFSIIAVTLMLSACVKKEVPGIGLLGKDYYPARTGAYIEYEVDSTVYTELPRDTFYYRYRVKEKITEEFTDAENKPAFRLQRLIKMFDPVVPYDKKTWQPKESWMVNVSDESVQVSEGNVRVTRLAFPVKEGSSWDGNAHNTRGKKDFMYEYIERAETIGSHGFEKVLKVNELFFPTLISVQDHHSKYAKGIGLVYRYIKDIHSNEIDPGVPVEQRIRSGIIYSQTIVTYGNE